MFKKKKNKVISTKEETTVSSAAPTAETAESEQATAQDPIMIPAPNVEIPHDKSFTYEDFTQSVDTLTEEELMAKQNTQQGPGQKAPKKKRSRAANIFQLALLFIFGSVLVVSLVLLGQNIWGKIEGSKIYDEASEQFNLFIPGQTDASGAYPWNNTGLPFRRCRSAVSF